MIQIIFLNQFNIKKIPTQKKFQLWINTAIKNIPKKIPKNCTDIGISIVDKKTSAQLNKQYRKKKGPTNILSFYYDAIPGVTQQSLGDLVICAELVEEEAKTQKKKSVHHWTHLTIHGILHLLDYDHMNDQEAKKMESLEIKILQQLKIGNPYKEVGVREKI